MLSEDKKRRVMLWEERERKKYPERENVGGEKREREKICKARSCVPFSMVQILINFKI